MPARCSNWPSSRPTGPAPMIAIWVRWVVIGCSARGPSNLAVPPLPPKATKWPRVAHGEGWGEGQGESLAAEYSPCARFSASDKPSQTQDNSCAAQRIEPDHESHPPLRPVRHAGRHTGTARLDRRRPLRAHPGPRPPLRLGDQAACARCADPGAAPAPRRRRGLHRRLDLGPADALSDRRSGPLRARLSLQARHRRRRADGCPAPAGGGGAGGRARAAGDDPATDGD